MDTIDGIKTVIAVVETGSFTAASERLGMSKALVSKYISEVESHLGVRLFNRSTRRLALTEAGKNYYDKALPLLEEFSELIDSVTGEQSSPRGRLRVSVPVTFGEMKLSPVIPKFLNLYPDIHIDIQLTDRKIDMLEEGVDVVIRIGGVDDSSLIAKQINTYPLILCASKEYLKKNGIPKSPQDITKHTCIIDSNFRIGKQWPIISPDQKSESIKVDSNVSANSPRAVKEMAIASGGIAMIPKFIIEDALENGALVEVLPGYHTLEFGLFAIFPHRRYLAKKIRCFIDFLAQEFS
ncbi:LysR family transcriptional regulator [Pseudoalteromonas denitrificans]|uniref:Transcriptional regulator, LysR family n=1 Tax=Pseudoalteromonas denitrificans DSM 6059 TaxID=1123010 RepID=A0A1I1I5F9_9GAMM|nr:LysR family transcriptional regulator [Pseudoalteromonas denitrificans]SFC31275.1 transcriptional regulator, LysR family [Pseudoalteromonas denitrificans DSM 6059]